VAVNTRRANVIAGGIGIVAANAMPGEITPKMAEIIASADAPKLLVPPNKRDLQIVGFKELSVTEKLDELMEMLERALG